MANHEMLLKFWKTRFNISEPVLKAFEEVDRELFVNPKYRKVAYEDTPLPILRGKTISQPTTVIIMTNELEIKPGEKVLEVGTGSGYQTAILARLVGSTGSIVSCEVIPELIQYARDNLKKIGIENVKVFEEDGSKGMPEYAPFDKIIITAACKEFPKPLIEQLRPNGIIIGPIGNKEEQTMVKGVKDEAGRLQLDFLGPFVFSPLYGKYGFEI